MQNEIKNSEKIAIYTKDKEKLLDISKIAYERHASKGFMCRKKDSRYNGKFIKPWIECVTCFVINKSNNKVLVEKRATGEINPEELDLVSGHVKSWELNRIAMIRELEEEISMNGYDRTQLADKLCFLGKIDMDFEKHLEDDKKANLRCFATVYGLLVDDDYGIEAKDSAVEEIYWYDYDEVKQAIRQSKFRFPYVSENEEQYEKTFQNLDTLIEKGNFYISIEEYKKIYLSKKERGIVDEPGIYKRIVKSITVPDER